MANDPIQSVSSSSIDGTSPRQLARIAGELYLINIVGGAFAISLVRGMLLVAGNAISRSWSE